MKRLQLWHALEQQALRLVEHWHGEQHAAQMRLNKLEASRAHIDALYADYQRRRENREVGDHYLDTTAELRHTQRQLLFLRERVDQDLAQARAALAQIGTQRVQAEQSHAKTVKLVEREDRSLAAQQARVDQRRAEQSALERHLALREAATDDLPAAVASKHGPAVAGIQLASR